MLYFDGNANYPIAKEVAKKYCQYAECRNVSSFMDEKTHKKLNKAVGYLQKYYGMNNVIFTSGGSESNSSVIHQLMLSKKKPKVIAVSSAHYSVSGYLSYLSGKNMLDLVLIKPNNDGSINLADISNNLPADYLFIQSVCSETGTIHPVDEIGKLIENYPGIKYAVDDTQGFLKSHFSTKPDYVSISFHKIGGPIGVGALITKNKIEPLIFGKQNGSQRGGTINIAGVLSSYDAINLFNHERQDRYFLDQLIKNISVMNYDAYLAAKRANALVSLTYPYFVHINTNSNTLGNTVFGSFGYKGKIYPGLYVKNQLLKKQILIGTGCACNSSNQTSIGSMRSTDIINEVQSGFIRVSFSGNSKKEINILVKEIINSFE